MILVSVVFSGLLSVQYHMPCLKPLIRVRREAKNPPYIAKRQGESATEKGIAGIRVK